MFEDLKKKEICDLDWYGMDLKLLMLMIHKKRKRRYHKPREWLHLYRFTSLSNKTIPTSKRQ